jgi:hypothetical protein
VDGLRDALLDLHRRHVDGGLPDIVLEDEVQQRLSRRTRVEETADLLRSLF